MSRDNFISSLEYYLRYLLIKQKADRQQSWPISNSFFSSFHNPMPLLLEPEAWTAQLSIKSKKKQTNNNKNKQIKNLGNRNEQKEGREKKKKRGIVKECEVLLKLHNRFWWRCSLSLESISLPTSLACPHRPGGRNSYQQHLLFRQSPHFSGGGGNVACYKKTKGGGHVQNSLFWIGPWEVMSCKGLGAGRWEHFSPSETPNLEMLGQVLSVSSTWIISFQMGTDAFDSSSQLMLSTGQVCGLFCLP